MIFLSSWKWRVFFLSSCRHYHTPIVHKENLYKKIEGDPESNQSIHHSSCSNFYLRFESPEILYQSKLHTLRNPMTYTSPKFESEKVKLNVYKTNRDWLSGMGIEALADGSIWVEASAWTDVRTSTGGTIAIAQIMEVSSLCNSQSNTLYQTRTARG